MLKKFRFQTLVSYSTHDMRYLDDGFTKIYTLPPPLWLTVDINDAVEPILVKKSLAQLNKFNSESSHRWVTIDRSINQP
jgi:hypothetical protein